jgi:hypothetical protein
MVPFRVAKTQAFLTGLEILYIHGASSGSKNSRAFDRNRNFVHTWCSFESQKAQALFGSVEKEN